MADPDLDPRSAGAADERDALDLEVPCLEVGPARELDRVRERIDAADVPRLAQRDAESLALAHRVRGGPTMLADDLAIGVQQRPRPSAQPARSRSTVR